MLQCLIRMLLVIVIVHLCWLRCLVALDSGYRCPEKCTCSSTQGSQLRIGCDWPVITEPSQFHRFPVNRTISLSIRCLDPNAHSILTAGTFRHLTKLQHLSTTDCRTAENRLREGVFVGLRELKTLALLSSRTPILPLAISKGAFMGLKRLEKLHLSGNGIQSIPSSNLCSLRELKWLNISSNSLTTIKSAGLSASCRHPEQLIMLDLSYNRLTSIPSHSFSSLKHLHFLYLSNNQITVIARNGFGGLKNVRKLVLRNNLLNRFHDADALRDCHLAALDLSFNHLTKVPPLSALGGHLTRLNLSHNKIDTLANHPFQLPSLRVIDLSFNHIRLLPAKLFDNLTMLTSTDLSHNHINQIDRFTFRDLRSLEAISLSHNQLQTLHHESFYHLENVKRLSLVNNSLSSLSPHFFSGMTRISLLNASNNRLRRIPAAISALYYLEQLDLSHNFINSTHRSLFDRLPNLQTISLSSNLIQRVERYVFENIAKLERIDLSHNRITALEDHCFHKSDKLRSLLLGGNAIEDIGSSVATLPSLTYLNVSSNRLILLDLSSLPDGLQTLEVHHNSLQDITNSQRKSTALRRINLSWNSLQHLDWSLLIAKKLRSIDLSHNQLSILGPEFFADKPLLLQVDLRHNVVESLNASNVALPASHTNGAKIYLAGNPLHCSCEMVWLKGQQKFPGIAQQSLPLVADLEALTCQTLPPTNGPPSLFKQVPRSAFMCRYDVVCSKEDCLCCDYESCDCKSVCPPGCTCYRDSKFAKNIVKCTGNPSFNAASRDQLQITAIPMFATEIHLDGLLLGVLERHAFLARFRLQKLFLNNSAITSISPKAFTGLRSLELLDLSGNQIAKIAGTEFHGVPKLRHLDLSRNRIIDIQPGSFSSMLHLENLYLANNELRKLPPSVAEVSPAMSEISLSNNPWACDCGNRYLIQRWLPQNAERVVDNSSIYCYENFSDGSSSPNKGNVSSSLGILSMLSPSPDNTVKINFWTFRQDIVPHFCFKSNLSSGPSGVLVANMTDPMETPNYGLFAISGACAFLTILIFALIIWRFRLLIKHRLATSSHKPFLASQPNLDMSPVGSSSSPFLQYDAFVCYSIEDKDMVTDDITSKLEDEAPYYELRLLYRDILTGPYTNRHVISDEIIMSMEKSQRIFLVLTARFLALEWRLAQIRTALQCVLKDSRSRKLVVILYDCVPLHEIDTMLGHYIRTNVCISRSDPLFWEKLREAMPDRTSTSPLNRTSSTELYGTIVPSDFV